MMKPRKRPGKAGSSSKAAREAITKSKPLSRSQFHNEAHAKKVSKKEGRGGEHAHWDTDFEEGNAIAKEKMPGRDENFSQDGTRRLPKN